MRERLNRPSEEWMSLQAASDALGQSRQTTLVQIVAGELVGQHIANRTVVRRDSVEQRKQQQAA